MNKIFLTFLVCFSALYSEANHPIYWDDPAYLSELVDGKPATPQFVYHKKPPQMVGDKLVPLNQMLDFEELREAYNESIKKYEGREGLLATIIPTLDCLWNDVVFTSPLHPHYHYEAYKEIGYTLRSVQFYKIPIEMILEKKTTVFKFLDYPADDPIHDSLESYCNLDPHYQEMKALPTETLDLYQTVFNPSKPSSLPKYNWYCIPHILIQDTIDISDPRVTIIDWKDSI